MRSLLLISGALCAIAMVTPVLSRRSMAADYFKTTGERPDPVDITNITGKVPSWLEGTLIRNVQSLYEAGNDHMWHWNDALSQIHLVKLQGGKVTHQSRYLNTSSYQEAMNTKSFPFISYGTPPHPGERPCCGRDPESPFASMMNTPARKDNIRKVAKAFASHFPSPTAEAGSADRKLLGGKSPEFAWAPGVDVSKIGNTCLALTDQNLYTSFDCETAETLEPKFAFNDKESSTQQLSAAHWRYDPATKMHYNYISSFGIENPTKGFKNVYKFWRWNDTAPNPEREFFGEILAPNMSFVHSWILTEKHIVFTRPPAHYNFIDIAFKHVTPYNATFVDGATPVKFHVLDRETGKEIVEIDGNTWAKDTVGTVAKESPFRKDGPGWFHTHTVNGYEEADGTIVADYCAYPDMGIFYGDFMLNLVDNPMDYMKTIEPARLVRCRLNVSSGTPSSECKVLLDKSFELPTFDMERRTGKPYRYAYAASSVSMESDFVDQLVKVDLNSGNMTHEWHDHSGGHWFVNEPVFISNPNGTDEDDGVLTCVVYDAANDVSSWLILDSKDFTELARIHLGVKVQAHFHGKFCKSYGDKSCVGL